MEYPNQFIKYVQFDEQKRILISVQDAYAVYLTDEKNKQLLKKTSMDILKSDFVKLEIGKNVARITVKEGTEDRNMEKIKKELIKGIEMALRFLKR